MTFPALARNGHGAMMRFGRFLSGDKQIVGIRLSLSNAEAAEIGAKQAFAETFCNDRPLRCLR
jgi:hypothetical protein